MMDGLMVFDNNLYIYISMCLTFYACYILLFIYFKNLKWIKTTRMLFQTKIVYISLGTACKSKYLQCISLAGQLIYVTLKKRIYVFIIITVIWTHFAILAENIAYFGILKIARFVI